MCAFIQDTYAVARAWALWAYIDIQNTNAVDQAWAVSIDIQEMYAVAQAWVCVLIQDTYAVARAKAHHQNLFEEIAIRNSQVRLITKTLFF
jgi:hypothetical protein